MTRAKGEPYELNLYCHEDKGCLHNPVPDGCKNCPFPRCCHDDPAAFTHVSMKHRDRHIAHFVSLGLNSLEVAKIMGLTDRTVWRSLARSKERSVNAS